MVIDQHKVFVNNNVQNIIKLLISVLGIVSSYPCTLYWNEIWIFYMFYGAAIGASAALIEWKTQLVEQTSLNNFHQSYNAPKIAKKVALNKNLQPSV